MRPMPAVVAFGFGPYQLDLRSKRLLRGETPVALTPRQFELLRTLIQHAGKVIAKQRLLDLAWGSVAVSENSLERMVSDLRALLDANDRRAFIETVSGHGYQFVAPITPVEAKDDLVDVEDLLAPHRAWVDGLAALETLERDQVVRARSAFEALTKAHQTHASFHIGLANAAALEFESTRADAAPLVDALRLASHHAHLACQLDPGIGRSLGHVGVRPSTHGRSVRRAGGAAARDDAGAGELASPIPIERRELGRGAPAPRARDAAALSRSAHGALARRHRLGGAQ